jgi:hypothetical protein
MAAALRWFIEPGLERPTRATNGDVVWKRPYNELFLTLRVRMLRPWERL